MLFSLLHLTFWYFPRMVSGLLDVPQAWFHSFVYPSPINKMFVENYYILVIVLGDECQMTHKTWHCPIVQIVQYI